MILHKCFLLGTIVLSTKTFQSCLSSSTDPVNLGTTILAVRFKGGVVVGADTRTSVSGYVSNRYAAKLTFVLDRELDSFVVPYTLKNDHSALKANEQISSLLDIKQDKDYDDMDQHLQQLPIGKVRTALPVPEASTCVICRSGSAADTQHLASVIRMELVSRQLLHRMLGTVTHVACMLRNLLANDTSKSASLICAGYDHELDRGVIYSITPGGAVFEERSWAAGGSGSNYIIGHLDFCLSNNQEQLESEEEALDFVHNAIALAMERDGSSGGFIRMYVIDRVGKRFVSRMANVRQENLVQKQMESYDTLKLFAPPKPLRIKNGFSVD